MSFLLTTTGGGGGVPFSGGFPTIIVNVCVVERLPPSVAVTVNVYFPSGSFPLILPVIYCSNQMANHSQNK